MTPSPHTNPSILAELPERVAVLEAFAEGEKSRRIPAVAVWSLVVTIALSAFSAVWIASQTYHEVASLRATLEKWEPKIEKITEVPPLQTQVQALQIQVGQIREELAAQRVVLQGR